MADPLIRMELPWPSKDLSPNGRVHWSRKARAARAARRLGHLIAANAGARNINLPAGRIHLHIDFYPPTRRLPDDDNMLTRCKPYRDGIADALGIDDAHFISHPLVHAQPRAGGLVVVSIGLVAA